MSTTKKNWKEGSSRDENGKFLSLWMSEDGKWRGPALSTVFHWMWNRNPPAFPKPGEFPVIKPNWSSLADDNRRMKCTWIGHATCYLEIDGLTVLTDPVFSDRCSPVSFAGPKRYVPPACQISDLPSVDVVVISHNHYDHLDYASIIEIEKNFKPIYICGLGLGDWFTTNTKCILRDRIIELDWWQSTNILNDKLTIQFVPVQHWSKRGVMDDLRSLWGGYCISSSKAKGKPDVGRFFFNGDTGYNEDLYREIGKRCGPFDLAAIPIGAYTPRDFLQLQHVDPHEAFLIHEHLKCEVSFGIHHATFILTDEPVREPAELIEKISTDARLRIGKSSKPFIAIKHGATIALDPSSSPGLDPSSDDKYEIIE